MQLIGGSKGLDGIADLITYQTTRDINRNTKDEIEPDDAIATKTELTIHSIISVLVTFGIFLAASSDGDWGWLAILMIIHSIVSFGVLIWNASSIHATWLSWVFEGVSTGVLIIGAVMHYSGSKKSAPAVETVKQFGKLLNFGKRRLK